MGVSAEELGDLVLQRLLQDQPRSQVADHPHRIVLPPTPAQHLIQVLSEPTKAEDYYVLVVEPSARLRAQRPANLSPAIITFHYWRDPAGGLCELRRVARGPVVVLTFDINVLADYWTR